MITGYVDPYALDIGHLDSFGDRMAVARLLGCRAVKESGRWVLRPKPGNRAGTVEAQLDHPTFLRLFGAPLESERVDMVDDTRVYDDVARTMNAAGPDEWPERPATGYAAGPLVAAYLDTLTGPAAVYGWGCVDSMEGGPSARVPAGLSLVAAEFIAAELTELAAHEHDAGGLNIDTGAYHRPAEYLGTLASVSARRAAVTADMPAAVNDRRPVTDSVTAAPDHDHDAPADMVRVLAAVQVAGLSVHLCAGGLVQVIDPAGVEYRGHVDRRGAVTGLTGKVSPAVLLPLRVAVLDMLRGAA